MTRIRQSSGGKFKRQNFGDLGLGAFKDQQDQVIESLKLQQLRTKEYSNEFASGLRGVAQSEKENRAILQNLENKYYENRRKAVELRGRREVEALEGQAKEAKKEADYWKDFSTTYSKQWGQLAQGLTKYTAHKQAQQYMGELENQELLDEFSLKGVELSTLLSKEAVDKAIEARKNNQHEEAFKANKTPWLAKPVIEDTYVKWVKDNRASIINEIKSQVDPKDWAENSDTLINSYILIRANTWGLDHNSSGVRDAARLAKTYNNTEQININNQKEYLRRKKDYDESLGKYTAALERDDFIIPWKTHQDKLRPLTDSLIEKRFNLYTKNGTKYEPPKTWNDPETFNRRRDGIIPILQDLIESDVIITETKAEEIYNLMVEDKYRQFDKDWTGELQESFVKKTNAKLQRLNIATKAADIAAQAEIEKELAEGKYDTDDFSPEGGRAQLYAKIDPSKPETSKTISAALLLGQGGRTIDKKGNFYQREILRRQLNNNDFSAFMYYYKNMSKEARSGFENSFKELKELHSVSLPDMEGFFTTDGFTKFAKKQTEVPGNLLTRKEHSTQANAGPAYEQHFYRHYASLKGVKSYENVADRAKAAYDLTQKDLEYDDPDTGVKGRGLLRRSNAATALKSGDNRLVWLAFAEETGEENQGATAWKVVETWDTIDIQPGEDKLDKIIKTLKIYSNDEFDQVMKKAHSIGSRVNKTGTGREIASYGVKGKALKKREEGIRPNAAVRQLVKLNNAWNPDNPISQVDVINRILKEKGIKLQIPENSVDMVHRAYLDRESVKYMETENPYVRKGMPLTQGWSSDKSIIVKGSYCIWMDNPESTDAENFILTSTEKRQRFMRPEIAEFENRIRGI